MSEKQIKEYDAATSWSADHALVTDDGTTTEYLTRAVMKAYLDTVYAAIGDLSSYLPLVGGTLGGTLFGPKIGVNATAMLGTEVLRVKDGALLADGTTGATPITGATGTRLMWIPSKAAFVAGRLSTGGTQWDALGNQSASFGLNSRATGANAFAAGSGAVSSGIGSCSIGATLSNAGLYGACFGFSNTIGSSGQATLCAGEANTVNALGCFVAGYGHTVNAGAEYAVCAGYGNTFKETTSPNSVALGTYVNMDHSGCVALHGSLAASFTTSADLQIALALEGVAAIDARYVSSAIRLGFFGATPIARPTTGYGTATFVQNSGNAVNDASTFDGYTLKQVVKALRDIGILT